MKKTPLFETHQALNAKIIDFGGWGMPVQYTSVLEEHRAVRNAAGLFDVSHMGEIEVKGRDALPFLQSLVTNDVSKIPDSGAQYTVMCYPNGGAVDDLLIYRHSQDHYLLCVNASNIEKDFQWILENNKTSAEVTDISAQTAQLAIQGPRSESILQKLTETDLSSIRYYHFQRGKISEIDSIIARTGYTGEDGFEIFLPAGKAADLWRALSGVGREEGLLPIGLGARDTLRLEMGYPLYGHELDKDHGPLCAGLGWIVKMDKESNFNGDFIGRDALLKQKEHGPVERLIGFEIQGRGIPRAEYPILKNGEVIGKVTSGSFSPSLNKGIGMGYVKTGYAAPGEELEIGIRSNTAPCVVMKPPFCKSRVKK